LVAAPPHWGSHSILSWPHMQHNFFGKPRELSALIGTTETDDDGLRSGSDERLEPGDALVRRTGTETVPSRLHLILLVSSLKHFRTFQLFALNFLSFLLSSAGTRGSLALTARHPLLYIVRMKQVTASEARKNWFRLLDEALDGEVIAVQRKGHRLVLRREDVAKSRNTKVARQYKRLLQVPDAENADGWSWDWRGTERSLVLRRRSKR
jgi:hypothetical protein